VSAAAIAAAIATVVAVAGAQLAPPVELRAAPPALGEVRLWQGTSSVALPALADGDPLTWQELAPAPAPVDPAVGVGDAPPGDYAALVIDFLAACGRIYEPAAETTVVERQVGGAWHPVAARLERDLAAIGALAHHQRVGTVRWRFVLQEPPADGATTGLRARLRAAATVDGRVARTVACEARLSRRGEIDDAAASARTDAAPSTALPPPLAAEADANLLDPCWSPVTTTSGAAVVVRWPLPPMIGEVEIEGEVAPTLRWHDGRSERLLPVRSTAQVTREDGARTHLSTFAPIAVAALRIELPAGARTRAVRLGAAGAAELAARLADPCDRWLDVVRHGPLGDDPGAIAAQLLPLPANQALLGRAGDEAEVLVTWNGTLLQTAGTAAGRWDHGAAEPGGARDGWRLQVAGFAIDGAVLGEPGDHLQRATLAERPDGGGARGWPGVRTELRRGPLEVVQEAFVTAPGGDPHAACVRLTLRNDGLAPARHRLEVVLARRRHRSAEFEELLLLPEPLSLAPDPGDARVVRDGDGTVVLVASAPGVFGGTPRERTLAYEFELAAGAARSIEFVLPSVDAPTGDAAALLATGFAPARARFVDHWREFFAAVPFELPDPGWSELRRALLAHAAIALLDGTRLKYGAGVYEDYYGLEEGWPTLALAQFGHAAAAQRAALEMMSAARLDPRNYHHQYRNGLAPVAAAAVARLAPDAAFLAELRPRAAAVAEWIMGNRQAETAPEWRGLLRKHAYGGDIGQPARSLYSNATCWQGLNACAELLERAAALDATAAAARIRADAVDFRATLLHGLDQWTDRTVTPPFVPIAVDLGVEGEAGWERVERPYVHLGDSGRGSYWALFAPLLLETGVLPVDSPLEAAVRATLEQRGGTLLGLPRFHAATDAVYGLGSILAPGRAGDADEFARRAAAYFAHALDRDVFTGGEVAGVEPLRLSSQAAGARRAAARWQFDLYSGEWGLARFGRATGSEPLSSAAGIGLMLLRRMVVEEYDAAGEEWGAPARLELLRLAPARWWRPGARLATERLPTAFGPVAIEVTTAADRFRARIALPTGDPRFPRPAQVRLWLRDPERRALRDVRLDGTPWPAFGATSIDLPADRTEWRLEADLE